MRLIIYRTYNREVVATMETTVATPEEYMAYLRKFNVQIDMMDAVKDIVVGKPIELTMPLESDFGLSV